MTRPPLTSEKNADSGILQAMFVLWQIKLYDILKTVDNYPITGWKMEEILRLLVGKEGTPVVLGLRRSAEWDGNGVAQGETDFNVTLIRSIRALPRDHIPGTVSVMAVIIIDIRSTRRRTKFDF